MVEEDVEPGNIYRELRLGEGEWARYLSSCLLEAAKVVLL